MRVTASPVPSPLSVFPPHVRPSLDLSSSLVLETDGVGLRGSQWGTDLVNPWSRSRPNPMGLDGTPATPVRPLSSEGAGQSLVVTISDTEEVGGSNPPPPTAKRMWAPPPGLHHVGLPLDVVRVTERDVFLAQHDVGLHALVLDSRRAKPLHERVELRAVLDREREVVHPDPVLAEPVALGRLLEGRLDDEESVPGLRREKHSRIWG